MRRFGSIIVAVIALGLLIWRVPQVVDIELHGTRTTGEVVDYKTGHRGKKTPIIRFEESGKIREMEIIDVSLYWRYYPVGSEIAVRTNNELMPVVGGPLVRWSQVILFGVIFMAAIGTLFFPQRHYDE